MIKSEFFFNFLKKNKIDFFCGVPDSVLKATDSQLSKLKKNKNIINHNEGGSIATAIGYYLSTKKIAGVYLQNSGLGNAINPIVSIASEKVYSIPMLLIIGWRGSPLEKKKDEPQHQLQGKITTKILKLLNIKFCYLNDNKDLPKLKKLILYAKKALYFMGAYRWKQNSNIIPNMFTDHKNLNIYFKTINQNLKKFDFLNDIYYLNTKKRNRNLYSIIFKN